jgi:exonuclease III
MQHPYRKAELDSLCETLCLDILALQEHRLILPDKSEPNLIRGDNGYVSYLLSAESPSARGGIGVVLSPRASRALTNIQVIDQLTSGGSRILLITLALVSARKLHVIACYSPTATALTESTLFYDLLRKTIADQPARDVTITLGDMNASLSRVAVRAPWSVGSPNANAPLLLELLADQDLVSVNSSFRKKLSHRSTFHGPRHRRVRLDHILVHHKWRRCFQDATVVAPKLIPSDHCLVWCKWNLREQLYRPSRQSEVRLYWRALRAIACRRHFENVLHSELLTCSGEMTYDSLSKSIMAAAQECLPRLQIKGNLGLPWSRDDEVKKARDLWMRTRNQGGKNQRQEEEYKLRLEELIKRETSGIARLDANHKVRVAWKLLRKFTGKKSQDVSLQVKGETPEERKAEVRTFFAQLLSAPIKPAEPLPPLAVEELQTTRGQRPELPFNIQPITRAEVVQAARKMTAGKATGPDGLPIDCFRIPLAAGQLCRLMNGVMLGEQTAPAEWQSATIIPIPKKRNARSLDQHRGISLMSHAAKLFNRVLLDRVRPHVDPCLRSEQNGFRRGRSTIHHILTLRRITEEARAHKRELHMIFVDFRKAFDSVSRALLPSILEAYGVPLPLRVAICSLYENTSAAVRTRDGTTDRFTTESGVLQGDVLAPFLFTLYIDIALRAAIPSDEDGFEVERRRSSRYAAKLLSVLAYADDLVLISSTWRGAQRMLSRLEAVCKGLGLVINTDKTKSMSFNSTSSSQFSTESGVIEQTSSFIYLGSVFPDSEEDFNRRKGLAWGMMGKMRPMWQADLSTEARMRLFQAIIIPVFSFAAETWTLTKSLEKQVEAAFMRLLRSALAISWQQRLTNTQVLQVAGVPSFCHSLRDKRRAIVANVSSGAWSHLPHLATVLLWCPGRHSGQTHSQGRSTYVDMLLKDAEQRKIPWSEWVAGAS